jgi:hypothetical protein
VSVSWNAASSKVSTCAIVFWFGAVGLLGIVGGRIKTGHLGANLEIRIRFETEFLPTVSVLEVSKS